MAHVHKKDLEQWYARCTEIYNFRKAFRQQLVRSDLKSAILFAVKQKGDINITLLVELLTDISDEIEIKGTVWDMISRGEICLTEQQQIGLVPVQA
jgi:hypothetical protein